MTGTPAQLQAQAVVFEAAGQVAVRPLGLSAPTTNDLVVDIDFSGISTGTERLLWTGEMPPFPGLAYPLVPGYESVGTVIEAGSGVRDFSIGDSVFVPGARCYSDAHGVFGGASSRVVLPESRAIRIDELENTQREQSVLIALAATAHHALHAQSDLAPERVLLPDLIVGHGVVGRLLARLTLALGGPAPVVWETNSNRRMSDGGYDVISPEEDSNHEYRRIIDASGDANVLDQLVQRLQPCGEIVLAGFYSQRISFDFPSAFMREITMRIAAEWKPADLSGVFKLLVDGRLQLDQLVTHVSAADKAAEAYDVAFTDPNCLKMILDWRQCR